MKKNKDIKTKYFHTINGSPAMYIKDEQICYLGNESLDFYKYGCDSLYQIRKEQRLSEKWREKQGMPNDKSQGYFRITINLNQYEK